MIHIALGGGSAKGLAHIGVLQAREEATGIQPVFLSGTSMGSIVASSYALGWSIEKMKEEALSLNYKKMRDLFGLSMAVGLVDDKHILPYFKTLYEDACFDDCIIPMSITATNLMTGEPTIITSGLIQDAIRCSTSLPGILSPYKYEGSLMIDGGVCSNLPITTIPEQYLTLPCLAVNVCPSPDQSYVSDGFTDTLLQTINIAMYHNQQTEIVHATMIQKPLRVVDLDLSEWKSTEFWKADDLMNAGYTQAKEIFASKEFGKRWDTQKETQKKKETEK